MKTRLVERRAAGRPYRPVVEALEQRFVFSVSNPLGLGELTQFESLEEYRNYFFNMDELVEEYRGVLGKTYVWGQGWVDASAATAFSMNAASSDFSPTNTQEKGVDEGDLVETDGEYLYLVQGSELVIVDASPDDLSVVSRTYVGGWYGAGEFLHGDRLTIISCDQSYSQVGPTYFCQPHTVVTVFDVSNASSPTLIEQTRLAGEYVTSRAVGDHVYVAVQNDLRPPSPRYHGHADGYRYDTEAEYRAVLTAWAEAGDLPGFESVGRDGSVRSGALNEAADVYRPQAPGERLLFSIVAFDVGDAKAGPSDAMTFTVGHGTTLYASVGNFYLVSPHSDGDGGAWSTIRKVAMNGDELDLVAAGQVRGHALNQFSMDEQSGYFRIATSDGRASHLYILRDQAGTLAVVGSLENVAPGEQLYSVRFLPDQAYLVTFQQIDPLFTVDLRNPTNPRLVGELEVPGFSTYLHPIGSDYLLAIGREGNWWLGQELQVSLFNVSDLSNPTLIDRYSIDLGDSWYSWGWSDAEWDHHAFSYFSADGVLAIPVMVAHLDPNTWNYSDSSALWVFKVDVGAGFTLLDRIEHTSSVYRSLRINDVLYSIGWDGIRVRDLGVLTGSDRRAAFVGSPDLVSALFGSGAANGRFQVEEQPGSGEASTSDDPLSSDSASIAFEGLGFSEDVPGLEAAESDDVLESLEAAIDDLFSLEADDLLALNF